MATSQYGMLIDATAQAIAGLASAPTVDQRKRIVVLETDTFPLVLCTPKVERIVDLDMGNFSALAYPVLVGIVTAHTDFLKAGMDDLLLLREQIRLLLFTLPTFTLPAVSNAYDVAVELNPAFDPSALDDRYDYSFLEVTYTNQEVRSTGP